MTAYPVRRARFHAVTAVAMLLFGVAMSMLADAADLTAAKPTQRRILGQVLEQPLAASVDPRVVQTLTNLRLKVQASGSVRVIVGVRAAFSPEGYLSDAEVAAQRADIAAAQDLVSRRHKSTPERVVRYDSIPFMALEVNAQELEALVALPAVTDVQEDRFREPHLQQSVPLIGAPSAWAAGYTGSGWAVAILDNGVDKTHPFLAGKVVSEACYSTNDASQALSSFCPGGAPSSTAPGSGVNCPMNVDGCEHGTQVAGIAAGMNSSFSGVAKSAGVIAIQVFSNVDSVADCAPNPSPCNSALDHDILNGLARVYAIRNSFNIAAVNMSLGGDHYSSQPACDASNLAYKTAFDQLRSVGIATIVASGNDGDTDSLSAPACISSAVSVGSTYDVAGLDNNCRGWNGGLSAVNEVRCSSNSATFLDLLAPGISINSSVPGGTYQNGSGTSLAAPHVAGCWAILKQARPAATVDEIEAALKNTGIPVTDWRNGITKPDIACNAALDSLLAQQPDLTISAFTATPTTVNAGGTVTLAATVKNVGGASSGATTLRYLQFTGSTYVEIANCADSIGALAPGATSSQSCLVKLPSAGDYIVTVSVVPVPGESNPSNNSTNPITVVAKAPSTTYVLTVIKTGTGSGQVVGTGITCGTDCTQTLTSGASVILTATATAGSTFIGWSGGCTARHSTCTVTMNAAKTVTATFAATSSPNATHHK